MWFLHDSYYINYGITTIFKELHEKNVKEKELESTIVKLRDALDHDFSSFRNDMSNKISGLRKILKYRKTV